MKETFLAGRLLLGGFFLLSGVHHFTDLGMLAHQAAAKGVPVPQAAVAFSGILLLIGALSLLLGVMPKIGIAALVLFLVPVTLAMHQFWTMQGSARGAELVHFTKNVGLLGGLLMLVAVPEPWPLSLRTRLHLFRRANA